MNAKKIIESAAALAPFAVAQFGPKNYIIPTAVAAVVGVYAYNRWMTPGYAPTASGQRSHSIFWIGIYGGAVAAAYWKPNYGLVIAAAAIGAMYLSREYHQNNGSTPAPSPSIN
jgi:hypothetical protein